MALNPFQYFREKISDDKYALRVQQTGSIVPIYKGSNLTVTAGSSIFLTNRTQYLDYKEIRCGARWSTPPSSWSIKLWNSYDNSDLNYGEETLVSVSTGIVYGHGKADVYSDYLYTKVYNQDTIDHTLESIKLLGVR